MFVLDDTIVAISTPIGQGGIGIVRLSGPQSAPIARRLFAGHGGGWDGADQAAPPSSHRLHYGHIVDPATGRQIDEVLVSLMRAPRTYTRQDVVEINAHGGVVALQEILSLCLQQGARLAREGEFTLRAFLNGRLDLAQAEAVLDIIQAKTEASLRVAIGQLGGHLSRRVKGVRDILLGSLAYVDASIDFPEDEIPPRDVVEDLRMSHQALVSLLREVGRGLVYRQGVHTAIVGRPNVGKSSLLNALLRADRAIVTPIPGTTRDTVQETLDLQGVPFVLVDTAGIADSSDPIERLGIERSRAAIERADLVLMVVDGSSPCTEADVAVATQVASKAVVLALNKSDLGSGHGYATLLTDAPHIALSALTGEGIPALECALAQIVLGGAIVLEDAPVASNPRHRDLFRRALEHVEAALQGAVETRAADLLSIDVREAVDLLGQVTGETADEDLLSTIFGRYCIGK